MWSNATPRCRNQSVRFKRAHLQSALVVRLGGAKVALRQVEAADVVQRRRQAHVRAAVRRLQDRQRLHLRNMPSDAHTALNSCAGISTRDCTRQATEAGQNVQHTVSETDGRMEYPMHIRMFGMGSSGRLQRGQSQRHMRLRACLLVERRSVGVAPLEAQQLREVVCRRSDVGVPLAESRLRRGQCTREVLLGLSGAPLSRSH